MYDASELARHLDLKPAVPEEMEASQCSEPLLATERKGECHDTRQGHEREGGTQNHGCLTMVITVSKRDPTHLQPAQMQSLIANPTTLSPGLTRRQQP
jgi:hypothetical protein